MKNEVKCTPLIGQTINGGALQKATTNISERAQKCKEEKLMKKQFVMGLAAAMAFGVAMGGVSSVHAATGEDSRDVPVTYDNRNVIPDPDQPAGSEDWAVAVPSSIVFTDDNKTRTNVGVELIGYNGSSLDDVELAHPGLSVNVKTQSTNGMTLNLGTDKVAYTLTYGPEASKIEVTGKTDTEIADLTVAAPKKDGKAVMTGTATQMGVHTDTLNYTIQGNGK